MPLLRDVPVHSCGEMSRECPHCHALLWEDELDSQCCDNGKVKLDPLQEVPPVLATLLSSDKQFREDIRVYNNNLAFTFIGRPLIPGRSPSRLSEVPRTTKMARHSENSQSIRSVLARNPLSAWAAPSPTLN